MKEYQEIRDTSPLGLKILNDQLRLLWFKTKNTSTKDVRDGAITVNKIASDVGKSLDLSSNEAITSRVSSDEFESYVTQTDQAITLRVTKDEFNSLEIGGVNLIQKSKELRFFSNNSSQYPVVDEAIGEHRRIKRTTPFTTETLSTYANLFYPVLEGDTYTVSVEVKPEVSCTIGLGGQATSKYTPCEAGKWVRISYTFVSAETTDYRASGLRSNDLPLDKWVEYRGYKAEKGNKATDWTPAEGELEGVNYKFDINGFEIKDSNNQVLITPAGILDTNNITKSDNVANGYPLSLRFYIDDQVNSVDKVFLRLTNENFRAYSTAASSGGGDTSGSSSLSTTSSGGATTSGASSATTTSSGGATTSGASSSNTTSTKSASTLTSGSVDDGFVHGVITSTGPATSGHTHTVWEGDFTHKHSVTIASHNHTMAHTHSIDGHTHGMAHTHSIDGHTHGMAHTHSVPAHTHGITYGLHENANANNAVNIFIDGVQRATTSTKDASVNLSSWITTKGWHTVELRSTVLKRISASLFVKSYIQR